MSELELRHFTEDQLESYIDVTARSRASHPLERRLTPEEAMAHTFKDPDFDPQGTWIAYSGGEAVGLSSTIVEKNRLAAGMNDGYVDIEVVPEHRGRGIEEQLLSLAIQYLSSKGIGNARTRSLVTDTWRRSLLEPRSFGEEYRVYLLVRHGLSPVPPVSMPEGYRLEHKTFFECSDAEIASMVEAFNDSFRDHFNFASEPVERWMNFRDCADGDPAMVSLAVKGDLTVGICLSEESKILNEERGERSGWIAILGVRPQHRRKGLARAMMADALEWTNGLGLDTVHLGVFAKNEKALELYLSFGFEKNLESIWYCRKL